MKVILEIDDKYASVLTITVVGTSPATTYVSTQAVALQEHNHVVVDKDGKWTAWRDKNGEA